MPLARLELKSAFGDQTIGRVRFAVHGTSNLTDTVMISDGGLRFCEGQPVVSTNLVYAHDWTQRTVGAGDGGEIVLLAVPASFYTGYGIFTSAFIDRQSKRVLGAPLRYAAARKQLSLYTTSDTESGRVHVEAEVANGYSLAAHPQYVLEPRYVLGMLRPGAALAALVNQLNVSVHDFEGIDLDRYVRSFRDVLALKDASGAELADAGLRAVIIGTVESIIMTRLRTIRWQGLKLLGFEFYEGNTRVEIQAPANSQEHRKSMDEMGRSLASSRLFAGDLDWLKGYVEHELELMRMELEAAELESLPD
jgi:hypothetical protein